MVHLCFVPLHIETTIRKHFVCAVCVLALAPSLTSTRASHCTYTVRICAKCGNVWTLHDRMLVFNSFSFSSLLLHLLVLRLLSSLLVILNGIAVVLCMNCYNSQTSHQFITHKRRHTNTQTHLKLVLHRWCYQIISLLWIFHGPINSYRKNSILRLIGYTRTPANRWCWSIEFQRNFCFGYISVNARHINTGIRNHRPRYVYMRLDIMCQYIFYKFFFFKKNQILFTHLHTPSVSPLQQSVHGTKPNQTTPNQRSSQEKYPPNFGWLYCQLTRYILLFSYNYLLSRKSYYGLNGVCIYIYLYIYV